VITSQDVNEELFQKALRLSRSTTKKGTVEE
jgi:putative antitoxin of VapBC-like toxin-antitoxin system